MLKSPSLPATLYVVATPIGNLDDFSPRAVQTLKDSDLIAAEDTRHSGKLLQQFSITTPCIPYHDHSSESVKLKILSRLTEGESVSLISDAGTPLISDPGYSLVSLARSRGIPVVAIPGASALTAALSICGLPTDRIVFEGFLPAKSAARRARLEEIKQERRSIVYYESTHRIHACLQDMGVVLGEERLLFVGRELTKRFETSTLASIGQCCRWLEEDPNQQRGEFVLVLAGAASEPNEESSLQRGLEVTQLLGAELSLARAVALAAKITGVRKNLLYKAAVAASEDESAG